MYRIQEILELFERRGKAAYYGEPVSQAEHGLQAARLAWAEGASDELVLAALFHDIGHLLCGEDETVAEQGIDTHHEDSGANWLLENFGPAVAEPARLHVAAKRYLCTTRPEYREGLSPASQLSLKLQGGLMSSEEVAEFEANPYYMDAIRLRFWDDEAKVAKLAVPGLEAYFGRIISLIKFDDTVAA